MRTMLLAGLLSCTVLSGADPENPKVEPGKVRWHSSFEKACAAARVSGKPVLLFQMLGRLDQEFC